MGIEAVWKEVLILAAHGSCRNHGMNGYPVLHARSVACFSTQVLAKLRNNLGGSSVITLFTVEERRTENVEVICSKPHSSFSHFKRNLVTLALC